MSTFTSAFGIICLISVLISAGGFLYFVYFFSVCYGFSIAGMSVAMMVLFWGGIHRTGISGILPYSERNRSRHLCDYRFLHSVARGCDRGRLRCPEISSEERASTRILLWTGVFLFGITSLSGFWQWFLAIWGYALILWVMFIRSMSAKCPSLFRLFLFTVL